MSEKEKIIQNLKNEISQLEKSIQWYSNTYEKRRLAGIIKDRFLKYEIINKLKKILTPTKEYKSKLKNKYDTEVFCAIVNHNYNDNAKKLRDVFSKYFNTIIFDSGSSHVDKSFVKLGNVYYSGLLNASYEYAKEKGYKYLLYICSDVSCDENEIDLLFKNIQKLDLSQIGVYSPSSSGRSHAYCKRQSDSGFRSVPFVEGFIFLANMKILDEICPIDTKVNLYGWGLDVAKGYYCRKNKLLCLIDDGVNVYHPEETGYSNELADKDMWNWINTFEDENLKTFYSKQIDIIRLGQAGLNKVSVIVPCYNQAAYLHETIFNLLLQEHGNIEILLLNDGSTDETESILLEYSSKYSNIRYIPKKNGGLGNTRNYGLKEATGEYIQFLDSDDLLSSNKIFEQIYSFITIKHIDVCYSEYLCFEDGNPSKTWTYSRLILKSDPILDLIENWETELSIPIHCFLYKTSLLKKVYFDEELPNHEDWEFHLKVATKKPRYYYQDKGIAYYRIRSNSMSRDRELMIKGKKMCIQKAIDTKKFTGEYLNALYKRLAEN